MTLYQTTRFLYTRKATSVERQRKEQRIPEENREVVTMVHASKTLLSLLAMEKCRVKI